MRIPRTALALVAGAALGLAGAVMQATFRNPLASPDLRFQDGTPLRSSAA